MKKPAFVFSILVLLASVLPFSAAAQSGRSDWDTSDFSRARLLLLPADADGNMAGGIEIQLEPGWHTYWQVPGDAGVPPQVNFSALDNIEDVTIRYPVPERYVAYGSVSIIYNERVVFPLEIKVQDPRKPVELALDMFYGACAEVCIPVKSSLTARVEPDSKPDPLARLGIDEFQSKLPGSPTEGFSIIGAAAKDGNLTIRAAVPSETETVDLFVKGPDNWYTGQPKLVSRSGRNATFDLSLKGVPDGADVSGKFDMLLVAGDEGVLAKSVTVDQQN